MYVHMRGFLGHSACAETRALAVPGLEDMLALSGAARVGLRGCQAHATGNHSQMNFEAACRDRTYVRGPVHGTRENTCPGRKRIPWTVFERSKRSHDYSFRSVTALLVALLATCTHAWIPSNACAVGTSVNAKSISSVSTFQERARALSDGVVFTGVEDAGGSAAVRPSSGGSDLAIPREGPLSEYQESHPSPSSVSARANVQLLAFLFE
jgi:hypothetical protein